MQSRPSTSARRLGAIVGPAIAGVFLLASCGGTESSATQSTINLDAESTAFVVRPPATAEPAEGEAATVGEDGRVLGTQDYTVQQGDYPFLLVERFDVTLDDLVAVNSWASADDFPGPGTVILIPPGALPVDATPAAAAEEDTDVTEEADGEEAGATETIPDAGDNCAPGTYPIEANDFPISVAEKFDVTLEALNAANADTEGYDAFFVGLEIVIPAKADC